MLRISEAGYIYAPPSNSMSAATSHTGSGLQQQQAGIPDPVKPVAKSAVVKDDITDTAPGKRLGSLIDVTA